MKVRNMRWGFDGGGVACGPIEGSRYVEICVTGNDQHNYFVVVSRMMEYERIFVSTMPLFDILIHMNHADVDYSAELAKCTANCVEEYDCVVSDTLQEELDGTDFAKVILLARVAMQDYYEYEDEESDSDTARDYIEPYVGKTLEDMVIPEYAMDDEEDMDSYMREFEERLYRGIENEDESEENDE